MTYIMDDFDLVEGSMVTLADTRNDKSAHSDAPAAFTVGGMLRAPTSSKS